MNVINDSVEISTRGHTDIIDITPQVERVLGDAKLKRGNLTVFVSGSTAGITSIEYEPGLLKDLPEAFEKLAPTGVTYHHDAAWEMAMVMPTSVRPCWVLPSLFLLIMANFCWEHGSR